MAEQRTLEAERADFEAIAELTEHQKRGTQHDVVGWYYFDDETEGKWHVWQAARRTASPALGEDGLPPLPEPYSPAHESEGCHWPDLFAAEHVRQAQRDAVADRPTWADVQAREKDIRALQSEVIELKERLARQSAPSGAAVAWAVTAPKGGIHKLSITRESAERKAARWRKEWPDNACQVRPLVFGDAAPTSPSAQPADQNKMEKNDE